MGIKIGNRLPYLVLAAVCVVSLGTRAAWLSLPCHAACRTPASHLEIFDERYYVNAARVIAGIRPPAMPGGAYRHAPLGSDPNAEHPQLAKLIMAGSIDLFGDGPWAWRLGSLLFGTLAILGMFVLVRATGAGAWPAVGAAALMAADNLMIVQGRIGTLEVYVVTAMVWALALYIRGRPLLAGVAAGIGVCMKLFALDVVVVMALWELLGWRGAASQPDRRWFTPRVRLTRLLQATAATGASFIGLLALMDRIARPYDNAARRFVGGGPFGHLAHMITYAAQQTVSGADAIASYPWQWLGDYKPIGYLTIDPAHPSAGFAGDHPAVHFLGFISPPILLAGLIGTALAIWIAVRPSARRLAPSPEDAGLLTLAAAWFLGTFGPFLLASVAFGRTTYLYYMMIVMPGMYVAAVWLVQRLWRRSWLIGIWAALVAVAAVVLYPLTPLP
ncbi:MAG: glycosyltransferase family 39 protein [Solirubrobacteraceae bacterium]